MNAEWRADRPVLVAEAQTLGALAVIRSLGRAGYPVIAASAHPDAIGFLSRHTRTALKPPPYSSPELLPWLEEALEKHGVRAIVASEGFLLSVRPAFATLAPLLPLPRDEATVYAALSKAEVHRRLAATAGPAGRHLPPSLLVESGGALPDLAALERLGPPLYLKVDGVNSSSAEPGTVLRETTAAGARSKLPELLERYSAVLVQGHVPGRGVGAFFLVWDGVVIAELMHRRVHEVPHTGGTSSLRESWWHGAIREDARAKLEHVGWNGVAMLEYRWDESRGDFYFIELNARFWGSLHLALHAGVDFPALLLDSFFGRPPPEPVRPVASGVRCRHTFPSEVQYVASRLRDRSLSRASRAWSAVEFFLLGADPRVHSDLWFPGDERLYVEGLRRFAAGLLKRVRASRWSEDAHS